MTTLHLYLEVAGCPTVCMHCWAHGRGYGAMPLTDVAWVLDRAHRFCDGHGLAFGSYPMHEVAAHPDAAAVMALYRDHVGGAELEPLTTTGVPLALRDDWRAVLEGAAAVGTTTVWLAFHGVGAEHDRQVNRPGAFAETCLAAERVRAAGLKAGCNVFVSRSNLGQLDELAETLDRIGVAESHWSVAGYIASPRGRRYEADRPSVEELAPVAAGITARTGFMKDGWLRAGEHAEAAWVRRATTGEWADPPTGRPANVLPGELQLVCRPNLDVHVGVAGLYRERLGNLRADRPERVFARALERGPVTHDALWFGMETAPPVAELAARFGDPGGRGVHFWRGSVRQLWLDRAARALRTAA